MDLNIHSYSMKERNICPRYVKHQCYDHHFDTKNGKTHAQSSSTSLQKHEQ